ncbi:MAG: hypothetical protein LV479_02895 [Methylacidiphilales bacterium]|nr:hypothetical protein [Candidatus Methylacidiphilales bacterium]
MDRTRLTDIYFPEARSRLIDLAAFLDRIDRAEGQDDFRLKSLRAALAELAAPGSDKARKILLLLSDPTAEPVAEAGAKSAAGAWSRF